MKITFWGATTDVTGSLTIVELPKGKILIDSGLTQGSFETEQLNLIKPPADPKEITAIILTHAHLDHCGYLPKLVKDGFRGEIITTKITMHLARIILADSASLDEQSLYTSQDVDRTINLMRPVEWHETIEVAGAFITLIEAGHILGASSVKIKADGKTIFFSGDLGRQNDPLIPAPKPCPEADIVIVESTYGGKTRTGDMEKDLFSFLMDISRHGKIGIIASFAMARAQLLLTMIHDFFMRHPEDRFKVAMDSPMMIQVNEVFKRFSDVTLMPNRLKEALDRVEVIEFPRQSEGLARKSGPLLILSSSGMLTGGRIQKHLKNFQNNEKATLFLPGYQAAGTPGRAFLEGSRTLSGPNGEMIQWKGDVIHSEAFSSHADQSELMEWLRNNKKAQIFLIHGEQDSKEFFLKKLSNNQFENVSIPSRGQSFSTNDLK